MNESQEKQFREEAMALIESDKRIHAPLDLYMITISYIAACKKRMEEFNSQDNYYLRFKQSELEIEKLKEELNNSKNFHCEHFLTSGSGTISCQVQKYGYRSYKYELEKRDKLLSEVIFHMENVKAGYPTIGYEQWLKDFEELKK